MKLLTHPKRGAFLMAFSIALMVINATLLLATSSGQGEVGIGNFGTPLLMTHLSVMYWSAVALTAGMLLSFWDSHKAAQYRFERAYHDHQMGTLMMVP